MESPGSTDTKEPDGRPSELVGIAPRLTAVIGMFVIGVIYYFLPSRLKIGPDWLLLLIEMIFVLPLLGARSLRRPLPKRTQRLLALVVLGVVVVALIISVCLLVIKLPEEPTSRARELLYSAILLWLFNVLTFGLIYWEIDGGGPVMRHHKRHQAADFQFPQQAAGNVDGHWVPHFIDYLFLAFCTATALSPADTVPLSRTAKMLMMVEALIAMTVIVILASRAINIL